MKKRSARAQIVAALIHEQRVRTERIERLRKCNPEIMKRALEVFNSPTAAGLWLIEETRQIVGLRGMAPIELVENANDRAKVLNLLGKIEHGIPP
jgi:uncharacterized protein (DUF2384 family)